MICGPCKAAGEALQDGRPIEAEALHGHCIDINCTCQHRTDPNMLNLERIPSRGNVEANAPSTPQPD